MEAIALPTLAATRKLAKRLASELHVGDVLALAGDLGSGKTTLAQQLAQALGVADPREVVSPTYTLVNEHPITGGWLVHLDLYRLADRESAVALGIEEQLYRRDALVVVEWADRFPDLVPAHARWVKLSVDKNGKRAAALSHGPPSRT